MHLLFAGLLAFTAGTAPRSSSLGSLLGERLSKPLPAHRLRPAFGVFLLLVGTLLVAQNVIGLFAKH